MWSGEGVPLSCPYRLAHRCRRGALSPCSARTDVEPSGLPGWLVGPSWRGYGDAAGGDGRPARDDRRRATGRRAEIMV